MDMQLIIVVLCVGAAAGFIVRRVLRAARGQCGCGCDSAGKKGCNRPPAAKNNRACSGVDQTEDTRLASRRIIFNPKD